MENDELWKKITSTFFKKEEVAPSEFFVQRVMAHVNELDQPRENSWGRWLVPSFGFGFAAFLFAATFSSPRAELAAETVLLATGAAETEWVFTGAGPDNEGVLGLPVEELQ